MQQPDDRSHQASRPSRAVTWFTWGPFAGSGIMLGVCTFTLPSATGRQAALALGLVGLGWALRSITPSPRIRPASERSVDPPTPALPAGSPSPSAPVDMAIDPARPSPRPALPPVGGAVAFGEPGHRHRPTSGD